MKESLWLQAASLPITVSEEIVGGFDVGFDQEVPEEVKDLIMDFAYWVEDRYAMPVTLWVDCLHRHWLLDDARRPVGYKFYWADFDSYPVFEKFDDLPVIELPVRLEKWTEEELLCSFVQAVSHYFAWLSRKDMESYTPDEEETEAILQAYLGGKNES